MDTETPVQQPTPAPEDKRVGADDASAFLNAPPPKELERQAAAATPRSRQSEPEPKSAERNIAPAPTVSAHMVSLAEGFGLTPEEAKTYGSDAELSRALSLANRTRQQYAQRAPEPKKEAKEPKEEEDKDDVKFSVEEGQYDPTIVSLVKTVNALRKQVKDLGGLEQKIPEHVAKYAAHSQQVERDNKLMGDVMDESGYGRDALQDQQTRGKIVSLVNSLIEPFTKQGIKPPEMKQLVRQVLPLVLGETKGASSAKATADAQRAALERERDERGRFAKPVDAPGSPSHRQPGIGLNGNATRTFLLDKNIDPGMPVPSDDADAFLK